MRVDLNDGYCFGPIHARCDAGHYLHFLRVSHLHVIYLTFFLSILQKKRAVSERKGEALQFLFMSLPADANQGWAL